MTSIPSPDAERLSQILLRIAAGLGVLLIAVIANHWLHSDGDPLNPVAEAAERAQRAPGARSSIEAIYTSPELAQPVVATGSGVYSSRTGRTRVSLDVPTSLAPEKIVAVGDDRTIYMRSPQISAGLPPGRPWLGVQPWLGRSQDTALVGNGGAKGELELLRAVSDGVDLVGEELVRGVPTERYRGTVDLGTFAALLRTEGKAAAAKEYEVLAARDPSPIDVEAWVDEKGVLRRERTVIALPTSPGQAAVTMDMRIDLFDFGVAPKIALPDADEVFDATPLARASLDLLNGESAKHLIRPAAGGPLAPSVFRGRGNGICRGLIAQAEALVRERAPLLYAIKRASASPDALRRAVRRAGFGLYEPIVRLEEKSLRRLGQLQPPPELRDEYEALLDQIAVEVEIFEAQARAFEVGDLSTARHLEDKRKAISDASDRSADAIGLGDCSSDGSGSGAVRS